MKTFYKLWVTTHLAIRVENFDKAMISGGGLTRSPGFLKINMYSMSLLITPFGGKG